MKTEATFTISGVITRIEIEGDRVLLFLPLNADWGLSGDCVLTVPYEAVRTAGDVRPGRYIVVRGNLPDVVWRQQAMHDDETQVVVCRRAEIDLSPV